MITFGLVLWIRAAILVVVLLVLMGWYDYRHPVKPEKPGMIQRRERYVYNGPYAGRSEEQAQRLADDSAARMRRRR